MQGPASDNGTKTLQLTPSIAYKMSLNNRGQIVLRSNPGNCFVVNFENTYISAKERDRQIDRLTCRKEGRQMGRHADR